MTSRLVWTGACAVLGVLLIPGPARAETLAGGIQVITLIQPACRIGAAVRSRDDAPRMPADDTELAMSCTRGVFPSVTIEDGRAGAGETIPWAPKAGKSNLVTVDRRLVHGPRAPAGGRIGMVIATVQF
jgi:hypothetical protein